MRLIDADELSNWILGQCKSPSCPKNETALGLRIMKHIDRMPSAQPERKKGKWIPVDSYSAYGGDEATWMAHGNPIAFYYCSECKEQTYADENGDSILSKFCPNCGTRMIINNGDNNG